MAGYLLARVNVKDAEKYGEYTGLTPAIVAAYGGRFIVRNGDKMTVEGDDESRRVVVVEFPSYQAAQDFYFSDEYQAAKAVREAAANAQFVLIDGA